MKEWGIAIIGCGTVADLHIAAIRELENARLIGVSSRRAVKAKEIGKQESCLWTDDYNELLQNPDVDVVCLTTSSGSHAAIGLDVLEAGKHLFVEKPVAMTTADADKMIEKAKEKGVILGVVSQRRFQEANTITKKMIEEGKLGKLLLVEASCPFYREQSYYNSASWRGTIREDGGALMNQGIHAIDLFLWMGGEVQEAVGTIATLTHDIEAEDLGLGLVSFKNGAKGTFMSSTSIFPGFPPSLNVYGEKGAIKIEGEAITHWTVPGEEQPELETHDTGGGASDPKGISHLYHKKQLKDLLEAMEQERAPLVTGEDGRNAVQLIESVYNSSRTSNVIEYDHQS